VLNAVTIAQALSEAGIKSPDWRIIVKEIGLQLKDCITANIFFEGLHKCESEMSWERLVQALDGIKGYELAAWKARDKTGITICS